ncbi:MAG: tRNA (adenine-N1)-methyltransferase [Thermoplasmata archaeon]
MRDIVLITDEKGRKYLAKLDDRTTEISGLGIIASSKLKEAVSIGFVEIGKRKLRVMRASLNDVISVIERKAQTLTAKDIAMILHYCDIVSGCFVIEGGAGSGALSIALLSRVRPGGKVVTYELRKDFAEIAMRNVKLASLSDDWILKMGDICKPIEESNADAFIVDIPNPWDSVGTAKAALRIGGYFCAFVPNVNQLEKVFRELTKQKFEDVRSYEILQREMVIHEGGVRPSFEMLGHTGYLVFARKSI